MKRAAATATLFFALAFGAFLTTHAQLGGNEPLTLTIDPDYPRPYQTVTVTPESTTFDLAASSLTVSVNGTVVNRTSGAEPTYVTVGGPGSVTTISVTATSGGRTYSKSISIRPADVSLVVEPISTTHPFYQGGALVGSEGRVRLVALPDLRTSNGVAVPAANLIYTWRLGDQVLQGASGIGKSVLDATAPPQYRNALVTVTVTTQDQGIVAQSSTLITPAQPIIRVYRTDPLLGPLFQTALPGEVTMNDTEESLRGVAYFFSGDPLLTWSVNGTPTETGRDITVRSSGDGAGTALLNVSAKAPDSTQTTTADLSVRFGQNRSFGFFGL